MQKLIFISQKKLKSFESEDHYIIDNVLENLLNEEVNALFLQANVCLDNEDFSESIKFYDLILKIDSNNIFALIDKGTTLQILGRIKLAIRCFDKALEIDPYDDIALRSKGIELEEIRAMDTMTQKSIESFSKTAAPFSS